MLVEMRKKWTFILIVQKEQSFKKNCFFIALQNKKTNKGNGGGILLPLTGFVWQ